MTDNRPGVEIAATHPLLDWYGRMSAWGVEMKGRDMILSSIAAGRFAIGVDPDNNPVLGVQKDDLAAILSVEWTSSAMIRGFQGKDWLALSAQDAGVSGGTSMHLRLFIPIASSLVELFEGFAGERLRIRTVQQGKSGIQVSKSDAKTQIPFKLKGF